MKIDTSHEYLLLPVDESQPKRRIIFTVGDKIVYDLSAPVAVSGGGNDARKI